MHLIKNAHDDGTIGDAAAWFFCKFSQPVWADSAQKCEKVPNYPMLKKVKKNSCIKILIQILFIIERRWGICISNYVYKFEKDQIKTVASIAYTDRQTDRQTHETNQHTCDFRK